MSQMEADPQQHVVVVEPYEPVDGDESLPAANAENPKPMTPEEVVRLRSRQKDGWKVDKRWVIE